LSAASHPEAAVFEIVHEFKFDRPRYSTT